MSEVELVLIVFGLCLVYVLASSYFLWKAGEVIEKQGQVLNDIIDQIKTDSQLMAEQNVLIQKYRDIFGDIS